MCDAERIIDELAAHRADLCGGPGSCDFCDVDLRQARDAATADCPADCPCEVFPPVEIGGEGGYA